MTRRFDLLVFDWDGTLVDSTSAIVYCIQASCRDLGLPVPSDDAASHVIGLGLKDALAYAVPQLAQEDYGKLVERYRYHFLQRDRDLTAFAGVDAMLQRLAGAGFTLAVATGKSRAGLDRGLAATGFDNFIHVSRCADECLSKPHPAMLLELMDELGATPPKTLMIGDTTHDLQMAVNARVGGVGVAYGAHPKPRLLELEPLICVDNVEELASWLYANA